MKGVREFHGDKRSKAVDLAKSMHRDTGERFVVFEEYVESSEVNDFMYELKNEVLDQLKLANRIIDKAQSSLRGLNESSFNSLQGINRDLDVNWEFNTAHLEQLSRLVRDMWDVEDNIDDYYQHQSIPDSIKPEDEVPAGKKELIYDTR